MSDDELRRGLARLQAAEFLYETSLFPELEYTFKHALTHEVAYGSLLQERRRGLHARIVEALDGLYPTDWPNRSNGLPTMPSEARCGTRPSSTASRPAPRPAAALALRGGGGLLRAGPPGPRAPARETTPPGDWPSTSGSICASSLSRLGEHQADARPTCARPRPSPGRSTTKPGWDGCLALMARYLRADGRPYGAIAAGQHALALAAALGDVALQVTSAPTTWVRPTLPSATIGRAAEVY